LAKLIAKFTHLEIIHILRNIYII